MDYSNLCLGCFSDKGGQNPCPYCGYEEKTLEASLYLPPRTILAEKYITGKVLGQGGFGITYLGWDMNLNMKLAIKEFFPQGLVSRVPGQSKVVSFTEAENNNFDYWIERFLKEARTLAQFEQHPNIVSVRDFFKANGTAYMIMSYVEGLTLDQYLDQAGGKLPYDKAIEVMMPVMDALREVHEVGVMHRDISPDNIFIDSKGRVVLIDFGAARQEIKDKSKSISVILKAGFAPEEQYRSRGKQGPWTDVYAVAATIYRLITGQVPPDAMDRLDEDMLAAPSKLGVEIEKGQEKTLLKALSVKAKNRYKTVDEFQETLLGSKLKPATMTGSERKECPFCGKEINSKALQCKYCLNILDEETAHPDDRVSIAKKASPEAVSSHAIVQEKEGDYTPIAVSADMAYRFNETELVDLDCPVEVDSYEIDVLTSAEKAFAEINFRNLSSKTVNALRINIYCFDAFGEEVKVGNKNDFDKRLQDFSAKPEAIFSPAEPFEIKGFPDTRKIKVQVRSVLFADQSRWNYDGSQVYEISKTSLSEEELIGLKEVSVNDAICYARQEKDYWQCICGRANFNNTETCIRCNREKKDVFENMNSEKSIEAFLKKRLKEEEKRRREKLKDDFKEDEWEENAEPENTLNATPVLLFAAFAILFAVYVIWKIL